jgi:hypothetical protein
VTFLLAEAQPVAMTVMTATVMLNVVNLRRRTPSITAEAEGSFSWPLAGIAERDPGNDRLFLHR